MFALLWLQGVIISLNDSEGIIQSPDHGELPFDVRENLSDVEFTAEDINEEVEFTVITVSTPPTTVWDQAVYSSDFLLKSNF